MRFKMKKIFFILVELILSYNLILAQENLFEKTNANTFTNNIKENSTSPHLYQRGGRGV
jgi:hypothetical protein